MHCPWNETCTTERKKKVGVLVSHVPPPVISSCLTMPSSLASMYGQVPKATATLTSQDQATRIILVEREDLSTDVPTEHLSF